VGLVVIAFLAGIVAGISPCILPVLPVAFVAWSTPIADETRLVSLRRRRALAVVAGLVLSFSLLTLLGSSLLSWLGLPQDLLRDLGIVLLVLLGIGLIVPVIGDRLERPFARFARWMPKGSGSGFVLGLSLGAVFVPCAGPVLTAIVVIGATHKVGLSSLVITAAFALGATMPLLVVALAGERIVERNNSLKAKAARLRPVAGALLIIMALAIGFNSLQGVQRWLPGYTASLQSTVEQNGYTARHLRSLEGTPAEASDLSRCTSGALVLQECGAAPKFTNIVRWFNTPGNRPLTLAKLRGKVILVDFWTYSCINCQRDLPHVEAWWQRYRSAGLVVVGVHTPEFGFEHVTSNVRAAVSSLGVTYPVAVDSNLGTWEIWQNQGWPAQYLIDAHGNVRHEFLGEGRYPESEALIRKLLLAANPGVKLPPPTSLPDQTPIESRNNETYLGTVRSQYDAQVLAQGIDSYVLPSSVQLGTYALGGTWMEDGEKITSNSDSTLLLHFQAEHIYLVLGGYGTLTVTIDGQPIKTVEVAGVPTLYALASFPSLSTGVMTLRFTPGLDAYAFTFG
jgi:cytochrome c biogenesis protein CcdA/thiol-disulfide isomerase/thioredoxin